MQMYLNALPTPQVENHMLCRLVFYSLNFPFYKVDTRPLCNDVEHCRVPGTSLPAGSCAHLNHQHLGLLSLGASFLVNLRLPRTGCRSLSHQRVRQPLSLNSNTFMEHARI